MNYHMIVWVAGFVICLSILSGSVIAQSPDEGGQNYFIEMQGSGSAEPYYPSNPPSPGPYQTPESNVGEGSENVIYIEPESSDSYIPPVESSSYQSIPYNSPLVSEPVGSPQNSGTAEPYYPSNPPSPSSSGGPVIITPIPEPYQEPVVEPYYPARPPTPEPTRYYPSHEYYTPVYHSPSYYYPQPSTAYWYSGKTYRSSCYDSSDYNCYSYSYVDGTLKVGSAPSQAEVYVDNRFRGYTPYSGYLTLYDIRPGTYTIRLKYSGYYDYYEDVYVANGRTSYVDGDMVRIGETYPKSGSISVQSEPTGAGVYLNNAYRGFTPVVLGNEPSGEYMLLIRKDGYSDFVSKVQVTNQQTNSISAILTPVYVPPALTPAITPEQTPVPAPTRSGLFGGIICFAILLSGILYMRKRL